MAILILLKRLIDDSRPEPLWMSILGTIAAFLIPVVFFL